jgi:hypothetical protein
MFCMSERRVSRTGSEIMNRLLIIILLLILGFNSSAQKAKGIKSKNDFDLITYLNDPNWYPVRTCWHGKRDTCWTTDSSEVHGIKYLDTDFPGYDIGYLMWVTDPVTYKLGYEYNMCRHRIVFKNQSNQARRLEYQVFSGGYALKGRINILDSNHFELKLRLTAWSKRGFKRLLRKGEDPYGASSYFLYERKRDVRNWFSKK